MLLRPYQTDAVDSALAELRDNYSTLIVLPTGAGKTVVFTEIAKRWQTGKVLMLAHREELVNQAAEKVEAATGERPCIEMADQTSGLGRSSMFGGGSNVVVGSVQSVCQPKRLARLDPNEFGLLIVDECFPAGTLVDGKPIESIRVGDTVTSFDERIGVFRKRKVTHLFKRSAPFELVRVVVGGRSVVSTLNHPFWTRRGWVEADHLCVGDEIGVLHGSDVLSVQEAVCGEQVSGEECTGGKECGLLARVPVVSCVGKDGGNESSVCVGENDETQSDEAEACSPKGFIDIESYRLEAFGSRREWPQDDATSSARGGVGLGDGVGHSNEDAKGNGLSDLLQVRRWESGFDDRPGSGRQLSRVLGNSREGQEERGVLVWQRVDDITVHKQADRERFGRLCPDGFVYNLEVEGEHTYVANGCVVHNCHHCTPQNSTYHAIVEHFKQNVACKLLGVTATPDRSDRLALGQVFETVAYEMTVLDAIENAWLVPIEQKFITVNGLDFSKVRTVAGDLSESDLESLMMQDGGRLLHEIASATVDAAKDEPCLIFANSVGSAEMLAKIINRYPGKEAHCLHGKTPKEERRYWLGKYADAGFQFLVGCDLFLEGFDSPRISVISNAKPTKSRSRYAQCIGRGTRLFPGHIGGLSDLGERRNAISGSVKPRCLVLDFVGNAAQHKLISTADILGGRWAEAAKLRAVEEATESGEPVDMRSAMAEASKHIADEEERKRRLEEKRAEEERERKEREWLRAKADYEATDVDGFGDVGGSVGGIRFGAGGKLKGPTPRMAELLKENGVDASAMTYSEASDAISNLKQYWNGTLCSPKQSDILKRFGENPKATRDQAKVLIDLISSTGWKKRDFKLTRERWRIAKGADGSFYPVVVTDSGKVPISAKFGNESACREFIGRVVEHE